jgi:glutamine amidotransferase
MCRLFGLKSREPSKVSHALVHGENALAKQSHKHPDGWGIAYLEQGSLELEHGLEPAHRSQAFKRLGKQVVSTTVLAHIRKASVGGNTLPNTHPFTHDGWVFAHNGTVQGFEQRRRRLERSIAPHLRPFLQGETDSERCFFLFLTLLHRNRGPLLVRASRALAGTARRIWSDDPPEVKKRTSVNFMATNGDMLLAYRFGRELCFSAPRVSGRSEARTDSPIEHLMVSSEPTSKDATWRKIRNDCGVATDGSFRLYRFGG